MNKNIRWITQTAVMLALLLALQTLTKGFGQLVTGTCVNAVLALTALLVGLNSGLVVALISPVAAYLLGIAPQILTVPAIMVGNGVYVAMLYFMDREGRKGTLIAGWILASVAKFAVLYLLVVKVICGIAAEALLAAGTLKAPMIDTFSAMFAWPQLFTALTGGAAALAVLPVLRKALRR